MTLSRRSFVKTAIGGAALAATGPAILRPAFAADVTKIRSLYALSGTFAEAGKTAELGARIAARQFAKEDGIKVDYKAVDSEGNPGRAVAKILTEIQQNQVKYFVGGVLSSSALAMSEQVHKANGVFITAAGADEITGQNCNRSTFRWSVPTYGASRETVLPLIEKYPNAKRWYTITPKYVFGEALLQNSIDVFKEKGVEHVGNSYHSLSETEFSSYLTNASAAKPDVLLLLNFGSQSTNTLRQAANFGMKQKMKILMVWAEGLEQYEEIGADIMDGVYVGCQYDVSIKSPGNKKIIETFKAKGAPVPSYSSVSGYVSTDLILRGIKAAGSSDPAAVIKALEGLKYEGPTGQEEIRAFDHQCVKNYYLLKGKPKAQMKNKYDLVEIISSGKSFVPQNQSLCKMA